jgi:hypothetical protein
METAPVQGEHSYGVAPLSRRVQANDVRGSSPIRTTLPDTGLASSNVTEFSHAAKHSGSPTPQGDEHNGRDAERQRQPHHGLTAQPAHDEYVAHVGIHCRANGTCCQSEPW